MTVIQVEVKPAASRDSLKIVWGEEGSHWPPYEIDEAMLNRTAIKVRAGLANLVDQALSKKGNIKVCGDLLKDIAVTGHKLFKCLFPALPGNIPGLVQAWLNKKTQSDIRIKFVVDNRIHIPWGLVYASDPAHLSGSPLDVASSHYQDFWCLKYSIATMYDRILPINDAPRKHATFQVVPIHNKVAFEAVNASLLTQDWQTFRSSIYDKLSEPVYSKKLLYDRWESIRSTLGIMFFYCHADASKLALAHDDLIDIDDLRRDFVHRGWANEPPLTLVFLNGCSTAVGTNLDGFLEATGGPGFCGFIGTETEVPDLFAFRYSLAFIYHFLFEGLSVVDTIDRLRKDHWPLSLLYSTYCHPTLSVEGLGANPAMAAVLQNKNFSELPLGAKKI